MVDHAIDEKAMAIITKMQVALEGEANDKIVEASCYIIANAVAILARDRADAKRMLKVCAGNQSAHLDQIWDRIRAELRRRGVDVQ